ncbi:hypothetical protein N9118_03650 [Akkermansiaceae bacterium]|nr:hypothetical protein [Akkermansiaceae bacterium]
MRAGPLSKPEVIKLLNAHFVPVYAVNEDYRGKGPQPAEERREFTRIYREALDGKMSAGTVHVYLTSPDGKVIDSMHVAEAARTETLLATLKRNIGLLGVPAGETLVKPKPQSTPPTGMAKDSVALHLVSRALGGGGSWGGVVENWIELTFKEYAAFRPPVAKLGERWRIKPEVSAKLLTHFYPSTENNDVSKNVFDHQRLDAKVIAVDGEEETATLRLSGALKMKHTFYNKDDSNVVQAEMVGFVQLDLSTSTIREFGLITTEATYGGGKFAVGLRLVALPKNQ